MTKKWSEVASSPQYQALSPEQQEAARSQYFDQVVAPQIGDPSQVQVARQQFDAQTRITDLPAVQAERPDFSQVSSSVDTTAGVVPRVTREQRQAQIADADGALDLENRKASLDTQESIGRTLGLGGRAMLEGLASVPGILEQPIAAGVEYITRPQATTADLVAGRQPRGVQLGTTRQFVSSLLDRAGVPVPETAAERVSSDITGAITGGATGVGLGNTLAASSRPVVSRVGQLLASQPGAQLSAAAAGGGSSGVTRELGGGPLSQLTAATVGGLGAAGVTSAANQAGRASQSLRAPATLAEQRAARQVISESGADRGALAPGYTPSLTPGVKRTYGEGTIEPGVMALENRLRNQFPETFTPVDKANNAARVQQIEQIAGTPARRQAVEAARSNAAQRGFDEAMQAGPVDVSRTVSQLDDAIASSEGRSSVQSALQSIRDKLARSVEGAPGLTTTQTEDRIRVLENVRKEIGDMLDGKFAGDTGKALAGSRELIAIRNSLNDEIASQVPAFGEYLNAYRRLSGPINRMDIGQELMNRSSAATDAQTGYGNLTPVQFGRAYRDLDAIAAKATGFDKAKAANILSPQDMQNLANLADDFSRITARTSTAPQGSPTAGLLQRAGSAVTDFGIGRIPVIGPKIAGLSKLADQTLTNETREKMAYLMANPERLQEVLRALPPRDADILRRTASQLAYATAASNTTQREDQ